MTQRPRIYYTQAQKTMMWEGSQKGDSLATIARVFDREPSSVQHILKGTGGIRPPPLRRSRLALTLAEREAIARGVVAGHSLRSIAALARAPSTVSRELRGNSGQRRYRASAADEATCSCQAKQGSYPSIPDLNALHIHCIQSSAILVALSVRLCSDARAYRRVMDLRDLRLHPGLPQRPLTTIPHHPSHTGS
jgi:hypothetical protein